MKFPLLALTSVPVLVGGSIGFYLTQGRVYIKNENGEIINNDDLYRELKLAKNHLRAYDEAIKDTNQRRVRDHYYKPINPSDGVKRIRDIEDYSVKLVTDCGAGTGWFLDYLIPESGKYPTKWFIATNAHVVSDYVFADNKYNQSLPIQNNLKDKKRACLKGGKSNTHLHIFKDVGRGNGRSVSYLKQPEVWGNGYYRYYGDYISAAVAKDTSKTEEEWKAVSHIPVVHTLIEKPRLFYAPINFLGERWNSKGFWGRSNYYKDFAVLEIDFGREDIARRTTDNLYKRIKNNVHGKWEKTRELNFFSKELMKLNSGDDLAKSYDNYFVAGYPGNSWNQYYSFGNYSAVRNLASKLTYWKDGRDWTVPLTNKYKQEIVGHVRADEIDRLTRTTTITWGGKTHVSWGYNYLLDNVTMGPGASGSLVTDEKGGVLGLYRMHNDTLRYGFVEPLRSEGIFDNDRIVVPKYDLLLGSPGQIGSYKSQLDTYYKGVNTYLRSKWDSSDFSLR